ncbi:MAG TPA: FMN-binding protein [Bryobacteraceae bacterium]|nr:FMN-binding protein [Bryobacteraceae bacterium]
MSNSVKMVRMLGAVSLLCGLLIVVTHVNTLSRIRHNQETIMKESVAQLLPGIQKQIIYGVEPNGDLTIQAGIESEGKRYLIAGYDSGGKLLGVVIEGSERGYADVITAMYAYSPEQKTVTGFSVIEMRETPGLGDRINKDANFLENFKALDASHPIKTVKHGTKKEPWEIDAISGATISSRAVGRLLDKSVQETVPVIEKNLDRMQRGN